MIPIQELFISFGCELVLYVATGILIATLRRATKDLRRYEQDYKQVREEVAGLRIQYDASLKQITQNAVDAIREAGSMRGRMN